MNAGLTEAGVRTALEAIGTSLVGGTIDFLDANEQLLAAAPIVASQFTAPDVLTLELTATKGAGKGSIGRYRFRRPDGVVVHEAEAGRRGSGKNCEMNRTGVEIGAAVRITTVTMRWPQPS